jgi:predicted HD superfamily hydrolase involved in NAD metabolism
VSVREDIIKKLAKVLDRERFEHSLRVEKVAVRLAKKHRASKTKASLAALLHDCARQYSRQQLLKVARKLKLKIDAVSEFEPKLLHAELSARLAKRDFGVRSRDILDAIEKHTIGAPNMSKLEKIIYLADHIEEGRDFSGVSKIRRLAARDLDAAIIESSSRMLRFLLQKGLPIHPGTVKTRNHYLLKK